MSGSFTDILTVGKNVATAVADLGTQYLSVYGTQTARNIITATLVKSGSGRVVKVIVLATNGSSTGAIYDANTTTQAVAGNLLWTIPAAVSAASASSTPVELNLPFQSGLVIVPGTGMIVVVSYS
jgi:hypothetical protein